MQDSNNYIKSTKEIIPEVIERAIELLDEEDYCCHALACAIGNCSYSQASYEVSDTADDFLHPLLERDNISTDGLWRCADAPYRIFTLYTRKDWLRKIAQELREGKISA